MGEMAQLAQQITTATVIKPGDHVLLTTADAEIVEDNLTMIITELERLLPGVTFTIMGGITGIAVQRADE